MTDDIPAEVLAIAHVREALLPLTRAQRTRVLKWALDWTHGSGALPIPIRRPKEEDQQ